ncbi:MAG: hypothetical protein NC084_08085 [Bacteroides sp.]|nr:hypothetical protein [Eubacterium sp.]MCM1418600.1 hypothetical protein [Roseburia sp.]MCM1462654.1 hypothetical protein [Bacteroides sp.]
MKTKMLGFIMILIGAAVIASGISVMSGASEGGETATVYEAVDVELKPGRYYLNGNPERGCIEIYDDRTFALTGYERQEYRFREWSDIAETNEETGRITLTDYYFLGTNLDGGTQFTEKIRFYPESDSLAYNGDYYFHEGSF